jgi:hypothetical protein
MLRPTHTKNFAIVCGVLIGFSALATSAQDSDKKNENFDVRSTVGDLHVGADADAHKAGLPVYPGARLKRGDKDNGAVNLGLLTEAFGFKLVVVTYESDDAPSKVLDFYRDKLKHYGKVLECHSQKRDVDIHDSDKDDKDDKDGKDSKRSKELKCEGDSKGPVTELKVGTEDNQHDVSVEAREGGSGSTFALVYVHARGKQGDI